MNRASATLHSTREDPHALEAEHKGKTHAKLHSPREDPHAHTAKFEFNAKNNRMRPEEGA